MDALEALFDHRADTFCLVTRDSDFAYLCRKLRERGATVCIVGEPKTPDALRNASDQFFEWVRPEPPADAAIEIAPKVAAKADPAKADPPKLEPPKPTVKRWPRFLVEAVALLVSDTAEGKAGLDGLGQHLKRMDPAFSPETYGHSGLLNMVKTYDLLAPQQEQGGHWSVSLRPKTEGAPEADVPRA